VVYSSETKKKRKTREAAPRTQWAEYERKADGLIAKGSQARFFIDTYKYADERKENFGKVRPDGEIRAARKRLRSAKAGLRALLRELDGLNAAARWKDDGEEVDVEEVGCSKCGRFDADDDNDVVLCDREGCYRAFHVNCCDPPPTPDDLAEDDWFCHQCNCMQRIVDKINETFDKNYDDDVKRWTTVFDSDDDDSDDDDDDDAKKGGGGGALENSSSSKNENTILGTNLCSTEDSDDDDDSDFDAPCSAAGDDDDDDDDASGSEASGDDPFALERDAGRKVVVEDVTEANIIESPRKRTKVNYVALHDALQYDAAQEGEDSDDESWSSS